MGKLIKLRNVEVFTRPSPPRRSRVFDRSIVQNAQLPSLKTELLFKLYQSYLNHIKNSNTSLFVSVVAGMLCCGPCLEPGGPWPGQSSGAASRTPG